MMFTIQHSTSGIDVRYSSSGTDVEHRTSGASLLYLKYMRLGQQFRFVLKSLLFIRTRRIPNESTCEGHLECSWGSTSHFSKGSVRAVSWPLQGSVIARCHLTTTGRRQCWLSVGHYRDASVMAVSWPLQGGVSAGGQLATPGRR